MIAKQKAEGKSYREIAKVLSEATRDEFAYSTVRYLYTKYIKKACSEGEQYHYFSSGQASQM